MDKDDIVKEKKKKWVFHPFIHITQSGETVLPNVFLGRPQQSSLELVKLIF
jgi:hypothetical protein